MLMNTHEVIKDGRKQYIVFIDTTTATEVFIPTNDPQSEYEIY
jgi:hypothetical protein